VELHPFFVHFPIALIVTAALLDWVRWFSDRARLLATGFWGGTTPLLILAFLGAAAAVTTGLLDEDRAERGNAVLHDLIETHQTLAFITAGLLAVVVLWRVALRGAFPQRSSVPYLILLLAVVATVGIGAYYGGMMVYGHGAGVEIVR
jgi:uncharacterized membrane protein